MLADDIAVYLDNTLVDNPGDNFPPVLQEDICQNEKSHSERDRDHCAISVNIYNSDNADLSRCDKWACGIRRLYY